MTKITVEIDSFLEDLIPEYMVNRKEDIKTLKKLVTNKESKQIEQLSHKIAGNAGSYGFHEMGIIAKKIEEAAESNQIDTITSLVDDLHNHFKNIEVKYK